MLLGELVEVSRRVGETSKRLAKIDLLAGLLRQLRGEEIDVAVEYLSGNTRQGRFGIGFAGIRDASSAAPAAVSTIEILELDRAFGQIAGASGAGSARQRAALLRELYGRATAPEQNFLTRLLAGELRQGSQEGLMIEGLAKAAGSVAPDGVRRAVMMAGEMRSVARSLLEGGPEALSQYQVQLFRPVQPMLAQTAEDSDTALTELGEAALEYKLDGARIQAHKRGDDVVVFSRRMNDVTVAVPEIVEAVRALPARELILDGEVLSLQANGRPQPFQVTMQRFGRRLRVEEMRQEIPLQPFWFDLLYLDGGSLLDEPQRARFGELTRLSPGEALIPHLMTADSAQASEFVRASLEAGHEGIMAKAADSLYAAGARGSSWLKIKQANTLDLVILAAEWGNGRRQGWLSNLHLGARDPESGGFAMLGKTFKGLTDEMLRWQTEQLLKLEIARDSYTVHVRPELVVEIAFNEIQVSARYPSGLALRFARVKRYRTDKTADQSDTLQLVRKMAAAYHPAMKEEE